MNFGEAIERVKTRSYDWETKSDDALAEWENI